MLKLGETLSKTGNAVAAIQFGLAFKAVARDNLSHVAVKSVYREVRAKAGAICKVLTGTSVDPDGEFNESLIMEDFKPYYHNPGGSDANEILGRFFMECIGQGVVVCIVLATDRALCLVGTDAGDYAVFDARTGVYQAFGADEEPLRRYMAQQKGALTAYFSDSTVPVVSKEPMAQEESGETTVQAVPATAVAEPVEEPKKPAPAPVPTPKKAQVIRKRVAPTTVPAAAPESAPKKASSQQSSAVEDE